MEQQVQTADWIHDKTEASARRGMVAARHPLSAEAGRKILEKGGNAVDAAIAASLVGSVVQPMANTIGGGGLMIISHPVKGKLAVNYLYEAPARAHANMFPLEENAAPGLFGWTGIKNQMNEIGGLAVGVPGSIAGLHAMSTEFGKLPWSDVVDPAIEAARLGFSMDWYGSLMLSVHADQMQQFPATARQFLRDGVYTYRPSVIGSADVHTQPALGETLTQIADGGMDKFYSGEIASGISRAVKAAGGLLEVADLEAYRVRRYSPSTVKYRNFSVDYVPYASPTLALFLNLMNQFDLSGHSSSSAYRYHLVAEALKRSWQYRDAFNGDTDVVDGPWKGLSSLDFAAAVAKTIRLDRVSNDKPDVNPFDFQTTGSSQDAEPGKPARHEGTVHISAADGDGCMVGLTETVVGNFGSLVTTEHGILLNNGMIGFSPIPGQMNSVAPGKRPSTNMSPVLVFDENGKPVATLGASGGRKIVPAVAQILTLFMDHQLSMQAAVSHPRLDLEGERVIADSRIPKTTLLELEDMGHMVEVRTEDLSTFEFGNPCGIMFDKSGLLTSGVNPFQATTASGF
jgi:gamma-glutamyltranspeptidase / glutathione hydrolase